MQLTVRDIKEYYEVITKVWAYFRTYYTNYDADKALEDLQDFEAWAKYKGPRIYQFGMQIIKIAWKEVGEIHEIRKANQSND